MGSLLKSPAEIIHLLHKNIAYQILLGLSTEPLNKKELLQFEFTEDCVHTYIWNCLVGT